MNDHTSYLAWFDTISSSDISRFGGKNASLGEMIQTLKPGGIRIPDGFATSAEAYRAFLRENDLQDKIAKLLNKLERNNASLAEVGAAIRALILKATFPSEIATAIKNAYRQLSERYGETDTDVAIRSSATAEDLPEASFAGQQESFLNIRGEEQLLEACRQCYASLFTDRAITYRHLHGFDHMQIALSIGVQKMVRSKSSGVLFTLDTETGFPDVILINAAWGLGENVVKGVVTPDQYTVYKPFLNKSDLRPIIGKNRGAKKIKMVYAGTAGSISSSETTVNVDTTPEERDAFVLDEAGILLLARWGASIEQHYGHPMDIEWARDAEGQLYILQARPETVQSRKKKKEMHTYRLLESGPVLAEGLAIGDAVATGPVCLIRSVQEIDRFEEGTILVTATTDPDWVPIMKKAAGIVTDHGGRTSHAAIVSRELGVPAIVGTGNATEVLKDEQAITLSCAEGDRGRIYDGILPFDEQTIDLISIPEIDTRIMLNIASPATARQWWQLPVKGVGLARMEYIINNVIKIHPMALVEFDRITDPEIRSTIETLTKGYAGKTDFFIDKLAEGIAAIAAVQYPDPVIVRTSDFKTNEYANLIGGETYEPTEENPMLGWRGASRYYNKAYRPGFDLECQAIRAVRDAMGFRNVIVMIPFCRTLEEADRVLEAMAENGLKQGKNDLKVYVMAEIPANITLAAEFAERFDGFSIGSNDLTQLMLGVDRDSEQLAYLFDERNEAVKRIIKELIDKAHAAGRPVGICGQGPSDYLDFAAFLVAAGIDSLSLLPDSVIPTIRQIANLESQKIAPHHELEV